MADRRRVGFIGLGVMGSAMADRLLRRQGQLAVCDLDPARSAAFVEKGAVALPGPRALGAAADIVITMLPDTAEVAAVVFGDDALVEGLAPGSVLIDMSTVSPMATRRWHEALAARDIVLLDAPVSGGQAGAVAGTLSIMVGGSAAALDSVRPVLAGVGTSIMHMGPSGCGQLAKACNQLLIANTLIGLAEAFALAEKTGLRVDLLSDVLQGGAAQTRLLELLGPRMLAKDYAGGFRLRLHRKDLRLALEAAQEAGLHLPGTQNALELLNKAAAAGLDELDHASVIELLRQ